MLRNALTAVLLGAISTNALALTGKCGVECEAVDYCCWNGAPQLSVCSTKIFDKFQKCQTCISALPTPLSSDDELNWTRMRDGACTTWSYCNSFVSPLSAPSSFTEACASVSQSSPVSQPSSTSTSTTSSTSSQAGSTLVPGPGPTADPSDCQSSCEAPSMYCGTDDAKCACEPGRFDAWRKCNTCVAAAQNAKNQLLIDNVNNATCRLLDYCNNQWDRPLSVPSDVHIVCGPNISFVSGGGTAGPNPTGSSWTAGAPVSSTSSSASHSGSSSAPAASATTSRPSAAEPLLKPMTLGGLLLALVSSWVV